MGKLLQPPHLWDVFSQTLQPHDGGAGREDMAWPEGAVKREGVKPALHAL